MKGPESIVVDYTLNEPPAQVWRALTQPALLAQWLMENDIQPIVGHKFNFRAKPMGDWNGVVNCEVLEVDEPNKLVYTWQGGSDEDSKRLDTTVTWTLTPTPTGGTLLNLVHHGFQPDDYAFQIMGQGWRNMITGEKMTRILATVTV
ncbi:MAG TPA: SRPBCC domain-containing protein [Edaphobacter sp.]|jgi:uncharacterized protein YndB with AHSA1/START domain|nr:SRPBCC domain-containing protein [Edaphobacter sp.]